MEAKEKAYLLATFVANFLMLYMIFIYSPPPVVETEVATDPDVFRIFYLHMPPAIGAYVFFSITFLGGTLYLLRKELKWDILAAASAKLGVALTGVTLLLGSIWAEKAWGVYWNWDPRETTTLILFFAYVAYLAYRMSIEDREKRARLSAVLGIVAVACIPLSYISTRIWATLHPMPVTGGTVKLGATVLQTLLASFFGQFLIFSYLLYLTVKADNLTEKVLGLRVKGGS